MIVELKVTVKHKHKPQQQQLATYNHTLATILVQYASAVRLKIWFYMLDYWFFDPIVPMNALSLTASPSILILMF